MAPAFLAALGLAGGLHAHCGTGRWTIKTASDAEAAALPSLDHPADVTISEIHYWHGGQPYSKGELQQRMTTRINSQERTVYRVKGFLKNFRADSDNDDYQLIISDGNGDSLVAAIPSPDCAQKSHFLDQLKAARAAFDQHHQPGPDFLTQPINEPVEIIGPAFYGVPLGQACCAQNFAEIHPILKISFGDAAQASPLSPTATGGATGDATAGLCRYKGEAYSAGSLECMLGHVCECSSEGKWRQLKGEKCP
jgi:hypothetical protein